MECDSRHRLRIFLERFGLGCDVAAESQLSTDLWHPVLNGGPVRARGSDDDDDVATLLREREREKIKFTRDDEFQDISWDFCLFRRVRAALRWMAQGCQTNVE